MVVPNAAAMDVARIKQVGYDEVLVNQPPTNGQLVIVDLAHEDTIPERWPTDIILVGDLNSKFRGRASMKVPVAGASEHIADYLQQAYFGEDSEEEGGK